MRIRNRIGWAALLAGLLGVAALGCDRGGTALVGSAQVMVPEVPTAAAQWLNGSAKLKAWQGQVVLVEAWHPS